MTTITTATSPTAVTMSSPAAEKTRPAKIAPAASPTRRGGWLRRLLPREYLPRSRRWTKTRGDAVAPGGAARPSSYRRLASSLSRSFRWKRMPALPSLSLRAGSASAVLDEVAFRVMYVVEAVVLGLALSCFFLCCGCHI